MVILVNTVGSTTISPNNEWDISYSGAEVNLNITYTFFNDTKTTFCIGGDYMGYWNALTPQQRNKIRSLKQNDIR